MFLWFRTLFTPKDPQRFSLLMRDWLLALGQRDVKLNAQEQVLNWGETKFNPRNLHRDVLALPRFSRHGHVLRKLLAFLEHQHTEFPSNFAVVRNRLLPVVRQGPYFPAPLPVALGGKPPSVALQPLAEDLVRAVVLDGAETMQYVTPEAMAKWDVPFERLWEYALENLERLTFELTTLNGICFVRGAYASSLMFHRSLGEFLRMQEPLVVIAPHTEALAIFQPGNTNAYDLVSSMVEEGLQHPRTLSGTALLHEGQSLKVWTPPGDSPPELLLKSLARKSLSQAYLDQKQALTDQLTELNSPLSVAAYSTMARAGRTVTFCVYPPGAEGLLPATDLVFFPAEDGGDEVKGLEFSQFKRLMGDAAENTGLVPLRYKVGALPEEIARRLKAEALPVSTLLT